MVSLTLLNLMFGLGIWFRSRSGSCLPTMLWNPKVSHLQLCGPKHIFFFFFYHIREQEVSHLSPPATPSPPPSILLSPHSRSASLSSPHPRSDAVRRREEGGIECPPFLPSPVKFQSQATVKGGIVSPWWGMPSLCSSKKRLHLARNLEESREVLWRFSRGWVGIGRPGRGEEEALPTQRYPSPGRKTFQNYNFSTPLRLFSFSIIWT